MRHKKKKTPPPPRIAYSSNYSALLVSLKRRFARGLQMGLSYTFSRYLDYTGIPVYRPLRTLELRAGWIGPDPQHGGQLQL